MCERNTYVLITAARNEGEYIEKTIQSVIAQTILPEKWVIVSDGSTDRTDQIVLYYSQRNKFMELIQVEDKRQRSFTSKVNSIKLGCERLSNLDYDYLGNLDADVSFQANYYESVLAKFAQNPKLGIAGGFIFEKHNGKFATRPSNIVRSVAGAIQLFRRECFATIGGYLPLEKGGEDWAAEVMARMNGWEVKAFPKLKVFHHKADSTISPKVLQRRFRDGMNDYVLGSHPFFEVAKCFRRIKERPYVLGTVIRLCGFVWSMWRREERKVSEEFVQYLRREQLQRLYHPLRNSL
jgi:glycosyltransferase involved in cell wall biosynthesis